MKLPPIYPWRMVHPWGKRREIKLRYKEVFQDFIDELERKLIRGHNEYGDASFDSAPQATLKELREEAIDLAGWGLILYAKLKDLEKKLP